MSKAFVIKNKEGKYYSRSLLNPDTLFEDSIVICEHFATEEMAKFEITFNKLKDCEPVEITIAEGDLGQENKQLKERINYLADLISKYANGALNDFAVKKLREQLAEKDKEINKLQQMAIIDMQTKETLELQAATIRKQVCDEIKREIANWENIELSSYIDLCNIIEKVEQGEKQ